MIDDLAIARALHVIAVVHWIGGVLFVTFVLLPALGMLPAADRARQFAALEHRFAWQARLSTLVAGATGFYMLHRLDQWGLVFDRHHWWLLAMIGLWGVFTMMLFVLEPLVLHQWFDDNARRDPDGTFRLVLRMHRILATVAMVVVFGAVAGTHGLVF